MKALGAYLFFNGTCREAMEFYRRTLGGDLTLFTVGQADPEMFKGLDPNLVLNARLETPALSFMASDNFRNNTAVGDNVVLYLDCSSKAEVDRLHSALAEGGESDMAPADQFWGAYMGSLTDRFGVSWMINFTEKLA